MDIPEIPENLQTPEILRSWRPTGDPGILETPIETVKSMEAHILQKSWRPRDPRDFRDCRDSRDSGDPGKYDVKSVDCC